MTNYRVQGVTVDVFGNPISNVVIGVMDYFSSKVESEIPTVAQDMYQNPSNYFFAYTTTNANGAFAMNLNYATSCTYGIIYAVSPDYNFTPLYSMWASYGGTANYVFYGISRSAITGLKFSTTRASSSDFEVDIHTVDPNGNPVANANAYVGIDSYGFINATTDSNGVATVYVQNFTSAIPYIMVWASSSTYPLSTPTEIYISSSQQDLAQSLLFKLSNTYPYVPTFKYNGNILPAPNMSVSSAVATLSSIPTITVPSAYLHQCNSGTGAFVLDRPYTPVPTTVTTNSTNTTTTTVTPQSITVSAPQSSKVSVASNTKGSNIIISQNTRSSSTSTNKGLWILGGTAIAGALLVMFIRKR